MQHISHPGSFLSPISAFWSLFSSARLALLAATLIMLVGSPHNPAHASLPGMAASDAAGIGLPLLQSGQHLGVHRGIAPNHLDLEFYWDIALSAGMDTQVVAFNWVDLEPTKGTYKKQLLLNKLAQAKADLSAPMLMLTGPQSDEMLLPHDLDGQEGFKLRDGRSIDDPEIIDRYKKLLDWVVPMLSSQNGWAIVVGNEVDIRLQVEPSEAESYLSFLKAVRDHVHSINPDMAVAMTVTAAPVYTADPTVLRFIEESDFASYTFYCDPGWSGVMGLVLEFVMPYLQASAEDKPIIFQEFGCSSGFVDGRQQRIAYTPEIQEEFIEAFIKVIDNSPQVRAAYAYQLNDLSAAQIDEYLGLADYLNNAEEKAYWAEHIELLGTLGLCENDSGATKLAWHKLVKGIETVR